MPPRFADRSSKPTARSCETRAARRAASSRADRAPTHDDDEGDGDRPDARPEQRHEVGADDPLGGGSHGQRDPVEDAERRQRGDDRRDLEPADQAGVDQAERRARRRGSTPTPIRIADGGGVGADQEGADDDAEADHRPDREVEVPDQERMGLGDRGDDQRQRQEQDLRDVGRVDEPGEPGVGVPEQGPRSAGPAAPPASTVGTLTTLRHLFLSRALRTTLRASCAPALQSRSSRVTACPRASDGAALGIATPEGERPAFDSPGPRTMASTMRRSSSSSPGISSMIGAPGHHQHPVAQTRRARWGRST